MTPPPASPAAPRATVLVIDDDESMRELLRLHLSNAGYAVLLAEDAVAGGHLVVEESPHLVIVDLNMPYMRGEDFAEALQADPATRAIPIVFLSAEDEVDAHARRLGVCGYLRKPVRADRLLELVARNTPGR